MISSWQRRVAALVLGVIMALGLVVTPASAQPIPATLAVSASKAGFLAASEGQAVANQSTVVTPRTNSQATFPAECPPTLHCVVMPAPYITNGGNIEDYGNFDLADRPNDMAINQILIHDTEGNLQETLAHFQSLSYVSIHYIVDQDGTVYQMVPTRHVAWHAGNWWCNMHCVGIEHIGHAALGGTEYTPAMYWASAQLVQYLSARFNIPRDRGHIIGHDNVQAVKASGIAGMHTDPGPFWNWQNYMLLISGKLSVPDFSTTSDLVTVAPVWPLNKPPVTGCSPGSNNGCVPAGPQPANFVYLRTEPRPDAPLITDPVLGQGSTEIVNNAARVFHGQTFAVADHRRDLSGLWYKVWANGVTGWFYSPWNAPTSSVAKGKYVTPKTGKTSIPVYGRPVPETSAYPADLLASPPASFWIPTLSPQDPLPYTVGAGQRYTVLDLKPVNDHFYAWSSTADRTRFPYDHTVFQGQTKFVQIQYGNRIGFVKLTDVDVRAAR